MAKKPKSDPPKPPVPQQQQVVVKPVVAQQGEQAAKASAKETAETRPLRYSAEDEAIRYVRVKEE